MNQESITGILSPNSSQCSGSTPTQCHPRRFVLSHRMEKPWPQFSWIAKVWCWWITFHIRQPWLDPTTVNCWKNCFRQLRKNGGECWPDVHCCCTTMDRRTCLKLHEPYSQGHRRWTAVSSTLLNRPGTQRLVPVSTSEEASLWKEV